MARGKAEIPLGNSDLVALVDTDDYDWLSKFSWTLNQGRHAQRNGIYMHREILGLARGDKREVDHKNGNGLDNRRANLRIATRSENMLNRAGANRTYAGKAPSSKFRGVCWNAGREKWMAYCSIEGVRYHLGYYESEKEAAEIVQKFRKEKIFSRDN